jgi:hypothetical protein
MIASVRKIRRQWLPRCLTNGDLGLNLATFHPNHLAADQDNQQVGSNPTAGSRLRSKRTSPKFFSGQFR